MSNLLILPNQLFKTNYFTFKPETITLYEHPQYFTKYNFNKKKLVLHRASMKIYQNYLEKKGFQVNYVEYNQKLVMNKTKIFDPIDNIKFPKKPEEIIESPNFLLNKEDYKNFRDKTDKFFFTSFYNYGKKINDIIPNIKSQDKQNRQRMSKDIEIPNLVKHSKSDLKYINEAIKYVKKHFPKNLGNTDNFWCPVSYAGVNKWFKHFLEKKIKNFGPYEDFIRKGDDFLFHSGLSCSINIGLLNPSEIIKLIKPLKNNIPLNSYEGYIRQ